MGSFWLALVACAALLAPRVESLRVEGKMHTSNSWAYLTRFCFVPTFKSGVESGSEKDDENTGSYLEFDIKFNANASLTLLVYAYEGACVRVLCVLCVVVRVCGVLCGKAVEVGVRRVSKA